MKRDLKHRGIIVGVVSVILISGVMYAIFAPRAIVHAPVGDVLDVVSVATVLPELSPSVLPTPHASPVISFVGPRENIPKGAPSAYGFWSFAIPVSDVLSRSGQPLMSEFTWMKENGWKSVVDLRVSDDHGEVADDSELPGFNELGFNYLHLGIIDGHAPTDVQAQQFLEFVTKPENQPVHVHCRGGYGRAGTAIVLYRYAVQGWPLDQAVAESRLFHGGISDAQLKWLTSWSKNHPAGSYAK